MNAQSDAFVAISLAVDEEHFAAVRDLAAALFTLRDAMAVDEPDYVPPEHLA